MHKGQVFFDRLALTLYMQTNGFAHSFTAHLTDSKTGEVRL